MSESNQIGMWNLRLGLSNKKEYTTQKLLTEHIDIFCLQECEVYPCIDEKNLTIKDIRIELEDNKFKKID